MRVILLKTHILIASFMLPVAIMFAITGLLHTWEIKGQTTTKEIQITLTEPLKKDLPYLRSLTAKILRQQDLELPEGWNGIVENNHDYHFESRGFKRTVTLHPSSNLLTAKLSIKNNTLYRKLVLLHKAEGGLLFKVYGSIFSLALIFMFVVGYYMTFTNRSFRKFSALSSIISLLLFMTLFVIQNN